MRNVLLTRRRFLGTLAALGCCARFAPHVARGEDVEADPAALARKVETLYAGCRSYRDTGRLRAVYRNAKGEILETGEIESKPSRVAIAFVRPEAFRFEFVRNRGAALVRDVIWMQGRKVRTRKGLEQRVETPESLDSALGASAGVTHLSSVSIPELLLPDLRNHAKHLSCDPAELSLLEDAAIGRHVCHRLRRRSEALSFDTGEPFEVVQTHWIDAKSRAIRRIEWDMPLPPRPGIRVSTTFDLVPEFDVEIPASALAFDTPAATPPTKAGSAED